jgi:hypothetical protein
VAAQKNRLQNNFFQVNKGYMKHIVIMTLIVLPLLSHGQFPIYYIELVRGDVSIYHDNIRVPLKPRTLLYRNDVIRINNSRSEVTLVNRQAEFVVLNKKGKYKMADLEKINVKAVGVTEKYFHLVWEELLQPHKDYTKYNVMNMGSWGGVSRGSCSIGKFPFPDMVLTDSNIVFKWDSLLNTTGYRFTIKNESKADIVRLSVRDTQISVDMSVLHSPSGQFYWSVTGETAPCSPMPDYKFTVATKEAYQTMTNQVLTFIEKTGNYQLKAAELLAQKGLYEAAAECIKKAATGIHAK